jgi:hypothetical protein
VVSEPWQSTSLAVPSHADGLHMAALVERLTGSVVV